MNMQLRCDGINPPMLSMIKPQNLNLNISRNRHGALPASALWLTLCGLIAPELVGSDRIEEQSHTDRSCK
jgi:hypothetical protein